MKSVAMEELSGVSGKGAQEAIVRATMRGTLEYLLDESKQTHSVISLEHIVLVDIEEMPDLIFDVNKEYQTKMHAKVPSQRDHLAAKIQGVLYQLVDGEKQCTFVGYLNNLDASDNTEDKMCDFSRNRDVRNWMMMIVFPSKHRNQLRFPVPRQTMIPPW